MILLDTSVLIDFLKGLKNESSLKFEDVLRRGVPFGITSFIMQEVLQGAGSSQRDSAVKIVFLTRVMRYGIF